MRCCSTPACLSLHPRSSIALRNLLWDYFDVPVEIEQYVGAWYRLDIPTQCRFDKGITYSEQVGVGVIVGDEIWDQQSGVRIRLGPLSLEQYLDFLPNGTAYQPLKALVRFFGGDQTDFEVQLVLKREEVPPCELGVEKINEFAEVPIVKSEGRRYLRNLGGQHGPRQCLWGTIQVIQFYGFEGFS